jgi:RecQ family ATP-dependent DNA helicase
MNGNDTIAILPTSYGKSVIYQMIHVLTKNNVLVVSPLLSLMEDQFLNLKKKNIDVICLNSQNKQKAKDIADLYNGKGKMIYTSPEFIVNNTEIIDSLVFLDKLALVVVDECHCVTGYGHSFRSDYLKLNCIKDNAPNVPIIALTGTATEIMINDIGKKLGLKKPTIIKDTMDRKNLYIEVSQRNDSTFDTKIKQLLEKHKNDRCIIYCKTTDTVDKIANKITKLGFPCGAYHGKKKDKERNDIQKQFTEGSILKLCSTIAFGMGIDIKDIRVIIHYNCSNDVDAYMQEIGRAGRDGKHSYCYMFYNNQDFVLNYNFASEINNYVVKTMKEKEINYLKKYVSTTQCRRKVLLQYYGENHNGDCNNCDNCKNSKCERDFTEEALLLFGTMQSISMSLGTNTYIKILMGSKDKTTSKYIMYTKQYHGKGNMYKEEWWKNFIGLLISNGYVSEDKIKTQNKFACILVLKPTPKAIKWYGMHRTKNEEKENMILSVTEYFKKNDNKKTTELEDKINEFKLAFGNKFKKETIKLDESSDSDSDSDSTLILSE